MSARETGRDDYAPTRPRTAGTTTTSKVPPMNTSWQEATHRAHERARAIDVRRIAARDLDALAREDAPRRKPSTYSLSVAAARAEYERLTTTGGVDQEPLCPWTPGEVALVLRRPS